MFFLSDSSRHALDLLRVPYFLALSMCPLLIKRRCGSARLLLDHLYACRTTMPAHRSAGPSQGAHAVHDVEHPCASAARSDQPLVEIQ